MGHKIPFIFDFIPGSHPHAFRVISSHERRTHRELAPDAPARSGFSRPPKQRSASRSIHCVFFNLQTPASLQKTISFKFNRLQTPGEWGGGQSGRSRNFESRPYPSGSARFSFFGFRVSAGRGRWTVFAYPASWGSCRTARATRRCPVAFRLSPSHPISGTFGHAAQNP